MTRPERRRRMKAILKELKFIEKHTPFLKLMRGNEFSALGKEEIGALQTGEHEDKELQKRFIEASKLFTHVIRLNEEYHDLKSGAKYPLSPANSTPPSAPNPESLPVQE
jgi:hypothetical protein